MDTNKAISLSKDWYNYGHDYVPEFPSARFNRFAAKSLQLAFDVLKEKKTPVSGLGLKIENSQSAYCVPSNRLIVLPAFYFAEEFIANRFGEEVKSGNYGHLAICAINGSTIHEALHLVYTNADSIPAMISVGNWTDREYLGKLGAMVFPVVNVFEDLFIESHSVRKYGKFIDAKNMVLFAENSLDEVSAESVKTLAGATQILAAYKNRDLRSKVIWTELPFAARQQLDKIVRLPEGSSLEERIHIVAEFCKAFPEPTEEEKSSASGEFGSGVDRSDGDGDGDSEMQALIEKLIERLGSEKFEKLLSMLKSEVEGEAEKIAAELSGMKREESAGGEVSWGIPKIYNAVDYPYLSEKYQIANGTDFSFIRELVALRTFNHTIGAARKSGSQLVNTRLARIATDGKVFAHRDSEKENEKRIEIVILVDASGSTGGLGMTVFGNELGAAKEIAKALRTARIPFCVVTHTTSPYSTEIPTLAIVESFDMKVQNVKGEESWECARKINLSENLDGVAIRVVAENFFTGRNARRFIIVLSDGEPAAPSYRGRAGRAHTTEEIAKWRKNGINIFSISVVASVEEANDKIYGEHFNLKASSDLRGQFRNLIRKISGGG